MASGTKGGCEAAIHSLNDKFNERECQGVLLLDASNAFNTLNRKLALHHTRVFCPVLSTFLDNLYGAHRDLYAEGFLLSGEEGGTQGCPSSMGMYCLGIAPLINMVSQPDLYQVWFADDGNSAGKLACM